ncbi:MAG: aromatic amino acid lyase, partial [Gaiellales bacterium]
MADLVVSGSDLRLDTLVAAVRDPGTVVLGPGVVERMAANRAFAERVAARGDGVYGLTRGVGARRTREVAVEAAAAFNRRLLREHATGQGPSLPDDEVRGAAICLLNQLAAQTRA